MADTCASTPKRRALHGTRQIVEFNWSRYLLAIIVAALSGWCATWVDNAMARGLLVAAIVLPLWWTTASLLASWWIYDASGLTNWKWLTRFVDTPRRCLNIHAGFDETTNELSKVFPESSFHVLDIYDPTVTTERSIARARDTGNARNAVQACMTDLPIPPDSHDAVFLLFAAHEVRADEKRVALFREVRRVLAPGGRLVLVEHLRDTPNFAAFGPGFWHFLSSRTWHQAGAQADLHLDAQEAVNPFVAIYVWRKHS
jgi:SAM-dependent methyltransferase